MSERTTTYFLEILQFRIAIVFGPDLTSKLAALNSKTLMIDMWLVKQTLCLVSYGFCRKNYSTPGYFNVMVLKG